MGMWQNLMMQKIITTKLLANDDNNRLRIIYVLVRHIVRLTSKMETPRPSVRMCGMFARVHIRRPIFRARLGIRSGSHRFRISRRGVVIYKHDEQP
jgi:hypothetical protein